MIGFENKPEIGEGIYTPRELSQILRVPYQKVSRWISVYWYKEIGRRYSWKTGSSKAVNFHTLVEFYVMLQFSEAGVKPNQVVAAHKELSEAYNTAFPFALKEVLDGIRTDGRRIYFSLGENTLSLDGSKQLNLEFLHLFFRNLEFDADRLASRFWPLGKENSILIDPERSFGHPVIVGRNIFPETLFDHYKAGDPVEYIATMYELTEKQVRNAVEFMEAAA